MIPSLPLRVLTRRPRGFSIEGCVIFLLLVRGIARGRATPINGKPVARYNQGRSNKSLDASGGSVFRIIIGAAEGASVRAAASTQPFGASLPYERDRI